MTEKNVERDLRRFISDMTEKQAVDWLINLVVFHVEKDRGLVESVIAKAEGGLSQLEAAFIARLWDARGMILHKEALEATYMIYGILRSKDIPVKAIESTMKHTRRKIKKLGWPLDIRTVYNVGYMLIRPDPRLGFTFQTPEQLELKFA